MTEARPLLLKTGEAAVFLGVTVSHLEKSRVYDPANSPPFVRIGRNVRYRTVELEVWAATLQKTASAGGR